MRRMLELHEVTVEEVPFPQKRTVLQSNRKEGKFATIVIEAWCDRSLCIWRWLTDMAGTSNDLNVLSI